MKRLSLKYDGESNAWTLIESVLLQEGWLIKRQCSMESIVNINTIVALYYLMMRWASCSYDDAVHYVRHPVLTDAQKKALINRNAPVAAK